MSMKENDLILSVGNVIFCVETESSIERIAKLKQKIKELEAEKTMLENNIKNGYFKDHEIYQNKKGLILATYKTTIREQFQSTKFKNDSPILYSSYCEKVEFKTLLIK